MNDAELDRLDRGTLRVWRWVNLLLWPLLALVAAVGFTALVDAVVRTRLFWRVGFHSILTGFEPLNTGPGLLQATVTVGAAAVAGLLIGDLVSRVRGRRRVVALTVVATYTVVLTMAPGGVDSLPRTALQALFFAAAAAAGALLSLHRLRPAAR